MIALYITVIVGAGMHLYLHTIDLCACPFFPA